MTRQFNSNENFLQQTTTYSKFLKPVRGDTDPGRSIEPYEHKIIPFESFDKLRTNGVRNKYQKIKSRKIEIIIVFFFSLTLSSNVFPNIDPALAFLNKNLRDMRRGTFEKALRLLEDRQIKTIVETGTARGGDLAFTGDGGFTIIFGYWCFLNQADLYSVDIEERAIQRARTMVSEWETNIHFFQDDSVHFLENFAKPIEFLYLDSFDFDRNDPEPSQLHHLREIEAAYEKLTENAVVMIDDCGLPHGGKGKFVIDYLKNKGWKIYAQGYQVIMLRS